MKTTTNYLAGFGLALYLALSSTSAYAVNRLGEMTDDSVCDVGKTATNQFDNNATKFAFANCKNGQILMGTGIIPLGSGKTEIGALAQSLCRIADIEQQYFEEDIMGVVFPSIRVRCRIEKLSK